MVHRLSMAGMALIGGLIGLSSDPRGAFAQPAAEKPHYETAFSADNKLCGQVRSIYDQSLNAAILKANRSPETGNGATTNFAYNSPAVFSGIGLTPPTVLEEIQGLQFFSIMIGDPNGPRTLAMETTYRGNSPQIAMAVFKAGRPPRLGDDKDALYDPPVKADDVEWLVSTEGLSQSQNGRTDQPYFLKKWPGFSSIFSASRATTPWSFAPMVYGAVPVTVAAFQSNDSAIIIYDQYLSLLQIKGLQNTSEDAGIVLVQRLTEHGIEDICYLVTAPGIPAKTLEPKHVQK
jgi:hypothetical protein